jgi:toluene monooxygenase system ferredoxin subunit
MFRRALDRDALWDGEMVGVDVGGLPVLLVAVEGQVHAFEDRCLHQQVKLSTGRLEGCVLTCGAHQWSYDVCTGCGVNPDNVRLRSLPVRVSGDAIEVDVAAVRATRVTSAGVGPVLAAGPLALAVVGAIRRRHPDVATIDQGSYLRVLVPGHCSLSRRNVEEELGAPFHLPRDLEQVMTSFQGRFSVDEDEAHWQAGAPS